MPQWLENILCIISILLSLLTLVLRTSVWPILENVPGVCLGRAHPAAVGGSVQWMSVRFSSFIGLFNSSVSLLIFWLVVPSIIKIRALKSATIQLMVQFDCFMYYSIARIYYNLFTHFSTDEYLICPCVLHGHLALFVVGNNGSQRDLISGYSTILSYYGVTFERDVVA